MMAPTKLTDKEVLETFQNMNDVIRMRMITTEVLPSPMQKYRIGNTQFVCSQSLLFTDLSSCRKWQNILFNRE